MNQFVIKINSKHDMTRLAKKSESFVPFVDEAAHFPNYLLVGTIGDSIVPLNMFTSDEEVKQLGEIVLQM